MAPGIVLGLSLLAAIILSISLGSVRIPFIRLVAILAGNTSNTPDTWQTIILRIRLPRVLSAVMVGGVLASGGVSCQGIFRNPLSEPYLLGISSGAAVGATIAIVTLKAGGGAGLGMIGISAFIGALAVTGGVFIAAGRGAFRIPSTLLLTGIAIGFLAQALIWLMMTFNRDQVERITFWTLGSFAAANWSKVIWLAAVTLPITILLTFLGRVLDVLSTGHDSAWGLGLNPGRSAALILGLTALGTAAAVSVAGSIGFVGLMVPHAVRILGGPSHRSLMIRSWIGGALLMVLADLAARTVRPPGEIPVGVVTALLGAPFLLALARGRGKEGRLDG